MTEAKSDQRKCHLGLVLSRYGSIKSSYDVKGGLRRSINFCGHVDDPDLGGSWSPPSDSPFHGKPVFVEFLSPPNPEWAKVVSDSYGDGVGIACGRVKVNAGIEAEQYEFEGETVEVSAISVTLAVTSDSFEAICRQAVVAYDHRRVIWAKVTLFGKSLPELEDDSDSLFEEDLVYLKDFDVSEVRGYAVDSFDIINTIYTDDLRGRVLPIESNRDEGYGTRISILCSNTRYKVNVGHGLVYAIACEGRIVSATGNPYDGADVDVRFAEYEPNRVTGELPERAFFGEFTYWPSKGKDGERSTSSFSLDLKYVPKDAHIFFSPLLTHGGSGTQVILDVTLTIENEDLSAATGRLEGSVRDYRFDVHKRLVDDDTQGYHER